MKLEAELEQLDAGLKPGRAELRQDPPPEPHDGDSPPPPRRPPASDDGWREFPRFHGGGKGLPRWQQLAIIGAMMFLAALAGWLIGSAALVFARGLEANRGGPPQ